MPLPVSGRAAGRRARIAETETPEPPAPTACGMFHRHYASIDLNLPKRDGYEVLTEIKRDPHLKHIPIMVLTIADAPEQVRKAFDLGANSYITKPVELEQLSEIVKSLEEFWLL
jgi:CheY-like chemotaxis protein